ncbi:MAG: phytanoyl-CoA dioxygenase family protein [Alphaproteobacteria bacterium]|nr:phytanoyl-CoA dioxygenase family protein [Alphaproteobacteria bacterium]
MSFDVEAHEARLRRDGYTVIADFLSAEQIGAARAALTPHLGAHLGRNPFEGHETERVYTLVARGKVFEDVTEEPRLLSLLDRFLQPGYLLTASQAICIYPGEKAQAVHFDDGFYRQPRPRPAISLSVICAIDAFTAQNGATDVISGSHTWSGAEVDSLLGSNADGVGSTGTERGIEKHLRPMVMPAGAAIVFQGTLLHRGGANRSDAPRLAFTNQYCEPWARTQENFYLGVPRAWAARMSPRLQSLLGYNIWPPFMGQVTASHPLKSLQPGWQPPVVTQARDV